MDVHARLDRLLTSRGWTTYRLALNSGLSHATIANVFRRNTVPSISTLEAICRGFGITLSQFFAENDTVELTPELREVFSCWADLTPRQKAAILETMRAMNGDGQEKA